MNQVKKYNLRQIFADIEEDKINQPQDMVQQINISQSVISALLLKKQSGTDSGAVNDKNTQYRNN